MGVCGTRTPYTHSLTPRGSCRNPQLWPLTCIPLFCPLLSSCALCPPPLDGLLQHIALPRQGKRCLAVVVLEHRFAVVVLDKQREAVFMPVCACARSTHPSARADAAHACVLTVLTEDAPRTVLCSTLPGRRGDLPLARRETATRRRFPHSSAPLVLDRIRRTCRV